MKRFYLNMFHHTKSDVPSSVERKFRRTFHHPIDVEWFITGNDYEALFYENKQERIARFDHGGNLVELRTNISPLDPASISNTSVREMGDLMNYIQIRKGDTTTHELIIKKPDMTRMLVMLDDNFNVIREERL